MWWWGVPCQRGYVVRKAAGSHSAGTGTELCRATKPWGSNLAHLKNRQRIYTEYINCSHGGGTFLLHSSPQIFMLNKVTLKSSSRTRSKEMTELWLMYFTTHVAPLSHSHHTQQLAGPSRAVAERAAGKTGVGQEVTLWPLRAALGSPARPSPTRATPDPVLTAAPPYSGMDTAGLGWTPGEKGQVQIEICSSLNIEYVKEYLSSRSDIWALQTVSPCSSWCSRGQQEVVWWGVLSSPTGKHLHEDNTETSPEPRTTPKNKNYERKYFTANTVKHVIQTHNLIL